MKNTHTGNKVIFFFQENTHTYTTYRFRHMVPEEMLLTNKIIMTRFQDLTQQRSLTFTKNITFITLSLSFISMGRDPSEVPSLRHKNQKVMSQTQTLYIIMPTCPKWLSLL